MPDTNYLEVTDAVVAHSVLQYRLTLFALISVYSLLLPVPINNQVARWQPDTVPANWRDLRRRWDLLHAIRVVFLVIALILLVASCVY